ncbi:hypothetical protein [Streptomyces sp. NPDC046985]|uniref:hypothetical protein n=1 Tax=Streptomyces sp. NPDC046985 TaxID=3155377 RepID=UPI0033C0BDCC
MTEHVVPPAEPAAVPIEPHFTVLLLEDGSVHVQEALHRAGDGSEAAWRLLRRRYAGRDGGAPVRTSVARRSGSVDAYLLGPDGPAPVAGGHPRRLPAEPVDPRWMDGMPDRHDLLELVRAAERAGEWHGALVAAERLAAHLGADLGEAHPHTVLAAELQGHFALRAREWVLAARLFSVAAAGRYALGSPAADTARALDNAVSAWTRSRGQRGAREAGLALAHLLVRAAPVPRGRLAAVLDGLGEPGR